MSGSGGDIGHAGAGAVPVPPLPPHLVLGEDMADRPFARVYHIDLERDYPNIWRDDAALAVYVRLLSVADSMWPAVPEVPRSARGATVKVLMDSGLLIAVPPFSYRIKGLDAERTARSDRARYAASIKYGTADRSADSTAGRTADRTASAMPTQSSPVHTSPPTVAQSAPKKNGMAVDERDLTEEQMKARYDELMLKQTGAKL